MSISCRNNATEIVCFNDGSISRSLIAHYEYAKGSNNTILLATRYTEADGLTVVDTSTGTVIVGNCKENLILEKEVCGTINGSISDYELIRIYTRDQSGELTVLRYEDTKGNLITGTVVETCCNCNSLCDVVLTPVANRLCFGYATSFNGGDIMGDRILNGEELYLEYLEVDNVIIVNTPILLGTTTGGLTLVDMGYGLGYNKIVDILNSNVSIQNAGITFVTAASPYANSSYNPMGWGIKYNDTKDVKLVIRDQIIASSHIFSFRLNPDPNETYDALGDARTVSSWNFVDTNIAIQATPLLNCLTI